ncbi:hypothetical protein GCM10023172_28290 [Hymenobacter ginsengisoli]|uniref:Uncharacterized protein n=1 Tax=Hymenobacter ginsengisoli TaxID=1051626 RepID=A0ABP8QHC8_9BACT|nr:MULTISPECIES: hypothetical protein [unclassified Hymenobacter]MBO2029916.1 hypothetical protein [Hymenobacter sp. BT559]
MKRTEILIRQDRIVYTLLIVTAAIGLAWVLWRHQYLLSRSHLGTAAAPVATTPR